VVVLGAEFGWKGASVSAAEANINWSALQHSGGCGLAIRVGPVGDSNRIETLHVERVVNEVKRLLLEAEAHQVAINELQLDFDCPVRQLTAYSQWISELRSRVRPVR